MGSQRVGHDWATEHTLTHMHTHTWLKWSRCVLSFSWMPGSLCLSQPASPCWARVPLFPHQKYSRHLCTESRPSWPPVHRGDHFPSFSFKICFQNSYFLLQDWPPSKRSNCRNPSFQGKPQPHPQGCNLSLLTDRTIPHPIFEVILY